MLTDLQHRVSALQGMASDLHGEKEKVSGQQRWGGQGEVTKGATKHGPRAIAVLRSSSCRTPSGSWG